MEGVRRFNGIPLRPSDPRCQKLVCRVRGEDDDLRAGVGGQRGMGMHIRWVKEQKERSRQATSTGKGKGRALDGVDTSEDDDPPTTPSESSNAPSDSPRRHRFSRRR